MQLSCNCCTEAEYFQVCYFLRNDKTLGSSQGTGRELLLQSRSRRGAAFVRSWVLLLLGDEDVGFRSCRSVWEAGWGIEGRSQAPLQEGVWRPGGVPQLPPCRRATANSGPLGSDGSACSSQGVGGTQPLVLVWDHEVPGAATRPPAAPRTLRPAASVLFAAFPRRCPLIAVATKKAARMGQGQRAAERGDGVTAALAGGPPPGTGQQS